MKNYRVLLIENNGSVSNDRCTYLERQGFKIIDKAASYAEAIKSINQHLPDMVLIYLGRSRELNGMHTIQHLKTVKDLPIFFLLDPSKNDTSFWTQFDALKSNYLLEKENEKGVYLSDEIGNFPNDHDQNLVMPKNGNFSFFDNIFFVKDKQQIYQRINISDLKWVKAHRSYCEIVTSVKRFFLTISMNAFSKMVRHPFIVKVHRSFLVNVSKIDAFDSNSVYISEDSIPVGDKFKEGFVQIFPFIEKSGVLVK